MSFRPGSSARRGLSRRVLAVLALAAAAVPGACDDFFTTDAPDEVRVVVDGDAPGRVRVITSDDFRVGPTGGEPGSEVLFVRSDTVIVPLPFDRTHRLAPTNLFAVRVNAAPGDSGDVRLRVWLDRRGVWNERSVLADDRLLQFYMVRQY